MIIVDEYAELAEHAPDATADADSIARRGRAVAVTLIAATQRPTQKAMGQGALRSQMDVRICFRVRERRDVDLILGQGMLSAGWQAHTLNAPGKFLISAPEHDTPRRARAYLRHRRGGARDGEPTRGAAPANWTRYRCVPWTSARDPADDRPDSLSHEDRAMPGTAEDAETAARTRCCGLRCRPHPRRHPGTPTSSPLPDEPAGGSINRLRALARAGRRVQTGADSGAPLTEGDAQ